jgi:hypothetical protein
MVTCKADKRSGLKGYLLLIKGHCLDFSRGSPMLSQRGLRELLKTIVGEELLGGHPLLECSEKCHFHSAVSSAIFLFRISIPFQWFADSPTSSAPDHLLPIVFFQHPALPQILTRRTD